MGDQKLVSIGVPVFNGAPHIRECLECLQSFDYPNIEFVISDNASTDETTVICDGFARDDPRFRVFRQDQQISTQKNFEFVLREARGEYFAWRAHDDLSDPQFASILARMLDTHPDAGLAASSIIWEDTILGKSKLRKAPDTRSKPPAMRIFQQFNRYCVHWIYGLYRKSFLQDQLTAYHALIGEDVFHSDVIWVASMIAAGQVVTTPQSLYHGRRVSTKTYNYAGHSDADFDRSLAVADRAVTSLLREGTYSTLTRWALIKAAERVISRRVVPKKLRKTAPS